MSASNATGMPPIRARWHDDPGHGWLEVDTADVERAGVEPSRFSYRSGAGRSYLEEDCDGPKFLARCRELGWTVTLDPGIHTNRDSSIRSLPRWPSGPGMPPA